ncbi:MAG: tryptophan synthase subunit alpha [Alphaproteobacteria bacterium]|nr:tryptophan synthase subunit alpha [Alphaproteobacteria bacterium]
MNRISKKFESLKLQQKCAFVAYICAGDPDYESSLKCLKSLPKNGVDIIEIGVPFLDPAGDGPIIENSAKRAISAGMDLNKTLKMVQDFRNHDSSTPIILMTYFNPLLKFGLGKIFESARLNGVDGFIVVDLPFEEESEIIQHLNNQKLDLIKLIAPTTSIERASKILKNSSGFVYLISMLGITGTKTAKIEDNKQNIEKLKKICQLPIVIGFGIQEPSQAQQFSKIGVDGVVVGSAIVKEMSHNIPIPEILENVEKKVVQFSTAIKS